MPKRYIIRDLLTTADASDAPSRTISEFVSTVKAVTERWQEDDWKIRESDESYMLNNTRIVGQVWFRGHRDCTASLRPGLYRDSTSIGLHKRKGSPTPSEDQQGELFQELYNLEHDQRIDFRSYGHLLNEANQATNSIDWYFLMQHHGVPTRLLDWSTNALAALFFALDEYRLNQERLSVRVSEKSTAVISVWIMDAYWLAAELDENWVAPLLPWSEDAQRYVPPLERVIDKGYESLALIPKHPMPIEPPAMHPRVAAQEGRFIIFGTRKDLLDERVYLNSKKRKAFDELRIRQLRFKSVDINADLRELAQLGVSRRTLFPDLAGLADFVRWKHFHKVQPYKQ